MQATKNGQRRSRHPFELYTMCSFTHLCRIALLPPGFSNSLSSSASWWGNHSSPLSQLAIRRIILFISVSHFRLHEETRKIPKPVAEFRCRKGKWSTDEREHTSPSFICAPLTFAPPELWESSLARALFRICAPHTFGLPELGEIPEPERREAALCLGIK